MCVEIQFCTHLRLWDVIFSLNKSKSLRTTGQALWHLYILSPVIFPLTHMYSVEPSLRRLNCTEVETGQRRKAPSPDVLSLSIPSSMNPPIVCWHLSKKYVYKEYHSICPLVGIESWDSLNLSLASECAPPPRTGGGGGGCALACGGRVGGVPIPTTGEKV